MSLHTAPAATRSSAELAVALVGAGRSAFERMRRA